MRKARGGNNRYINKYINADAPGLADELEEARARAQRERERARVLGLRLGEARRARRERGQRREDGHQVRVALTH